MNATTRMGPWQVGHASGLENLLQQRPATGGFDQRQPRRGDDCGRPVRCCGRRLFPHAPGAEGVPAVVPRRDVALVLLHSAADATAVQWWQERLRAWGDVCDRECLSATPTGYRRRRCSERRRSEPNRLIARANRGFGVMADSYAWRAVGSDIRT